MPNQSVHLTPEAGAFFVFAISEQNFAFVKSSLASGVGDFYVRIAKGKPMEQVFLSYAQADRNAADRLYRDLKRRGVKVWFDVTSLQPGEHWQIAIKNAIRKSRYFLALLSDNSVDHIGYVQKELKFAIDTLDFFPETSIFIIPLRLNSCIPTHDRLKDLQWVDLFPEVTYQIAIQRILDVVSPTNKALRANFIDLTVEDVVSLVRHHDFYESIINPVGSGIIHEYQILAYEGEEVIFDFTTGLLWVRAGAHYEILELYLSDKDAIHWLNNLNRFGYAGRNDWRLPTLPEAMSLIQPESTTQHLFPGIHYEPWEREDLTKWKPKYSMFSKEVSLYIDPVFKGVKVMLTGDKLADTKAYWRVYVDLGRCGYELREIARGKEGGNIGGSCNIRPVCSPEIEYINQLRSVTGKEDKFEF